MVRFPLGQETLNPPGRVARDGGEVLADKLFLKLLLSFPWSPTACQHYALDRKKPTSMIERDDDVQWKVFGR